MAAAPEAQQQNPIRIGIVGCATIAYKLTRAFSFSPTTITITAVGSRSFSKAQQFITANNLPSTVKAHGTYDAVLDDPNVDAVYMPLPTGLHVKWAVAAAERGKHLLLEKPPALCVAELDRILEACERNGVQFMETTMWVHHPRTAKMREFLSDPDKFGQLRTVHSTFSFCAGSDFLQNDIRVKPDLDGLGALGDAGWYCIRSILWATDFQLPNKVVALRNPVFNQSGVILSCGSSLMWDDGKIATFHCSFLAHLTMEVTAVGSRGTLHLDDFIIPFEENKAHFSFASDSGFTELVTGWKPLPSKHVVVTEIPQEALMVREFVRLVKDVKDSGLKPEKKWPEITRKTQLVLNAVKSSIEKGFEPVEIASY